MHKPVSRCVSCQQQMDKIGIQVMFATLHNLQHVPATWKVHLKGPLASSKAPLFQCAPVGGTLRQGETALLKVRIQCFLVY